MILKTLKAYIDDAVNAGHFPGASYSLIEPSGQILSGHTGYVSLLPNKKSLQENTIYDIASLTKVVATTTMIMKLIETKAIHLHQNISSILEEFDHFPVTIFQLLTHTSGLPADISRASELRTRHDVMDRIRAMSLNHLPGETLVYSDVGFILLGFIVEKVTNQTLDEYARALIFKPLNMNDTSYFPNRARTAPTESRNDAIFSGFLQGRVHDEKAFAMGHEAGHAGLFSTAKDLALFMKAILDKQFILKEETVDMLFETACKHPLENGRFLQRSLGWIKADYGSIAGDGVDFEDTICHTGFTGCHMFIDRKNSIGFVLLSNAVHPKRQNNRILEHRNPIGNLVKPPLKG